MRIKFNEEITLRVPSGFADGERIYRDLPGLALKQENSVYTGEFGEVNDDTVFLIKSSERPYPGWLVVDSTGSERELRSVKVCCSLDGEVVAFRCKV